MAENFAVLDALNQSQPTDFDTVDANMMFKSDENRVATAMDAKLFVQFFSKPVKNDEKSIAAGRAIFEPHEFVIIKIPGDKNNDVVKDLTLEPYYIQRFPIHYARFKKNQEQIVGTPLNVVPFLTEVQVEEYKAINIRTVEQLAGMSDVNCQTLMGSVKHKQDAQAFLDTFKSAETLRKDFEASQAAQAAQIAELQAKLAELTNKTPQPIHQVKR
jgi:hypothetical protein